MYKIIANWKMYLTIRQSRELAAEVAKWWSKADCRGVELIVCPSTLALTEVARHFEGTPVKLASQSLSLTESLGAFTGQVAAQQLKEINVETVMLGHSEQRQFLKMTDDLVRLQLKVAFHHKLYPVVCVGETEEQRQARRADAVVVTQLHQIFKDLIIPASGAAIAYEPIWAIGTGKPVDPQEANRMHDLIRHTMTEFSYQDKQANVSVLYGGSVNADNFSAFLDQPSVNGLLVGSASTRVGTLGPLIERLQSQYCEI